MKDKLTIVIVATDKKNNDNDMYVPRICQLLNNKPIIQHIINTTLKLKPYKILIITSPHNIDCINKTISLNNPSKITSKISLTVQKNNVISSLLNVEKCIKNHNILIVPGDRPLIRAKTLRKFVKSELDYASGIYKLKYEYFNSGILYFSKLDFDKIKTLKHKEGNYVQSFKTIYSMNNILVDNIECLKTKNIKMYL